MNIPKIIWQTYKTSYDELPDYAKAAANTWQVMNPDYEYRYMSDEQVYEFVLENFGQNVVDLMKSFKVPVMRADLWRYLIVYINGGIYADLDTICNSPADTWIPENANMVVGPENGMHYAQWCFAAAPKSPVVKSIIDLVLERCKNIDYDMPSFVHYHTANAAFTDGIRKYFDLPSLYHACVEMETAHICNHQYLAEEAQTYRTNKKMSDVGFFCHYGEDSNMFVSGGVTHLFGSNNWTDGGYEQWTRNPLAARSRAYVDGAADEESIILGDLVAAPVIYLCDITANLDVNTGIQRVVRKLAKGVIDLGVELIPVRLAKHGFEYLSDEQLDNLAKWGGPAKDSWSKRENFKQSIEKAKHFLTAELIYNESGHPYQIHELISYCSSKNIKTAFVFHDAIPVTLKHIYENFENANHSSAPHIDYMRNINGADYIFPNSKNSAHEFVMYVKHDRAHNFMKEGDLIAISLPTEIDANIGRKAAKAYDPNNLEMTIVSSFDKRKNHEYLFNAFKDALPILKKIGINLRLNVVGAAYHPEHLNTINWWAKRLPLNLYINCTDEELISVYEKTDFSVYPSLYEGFGLPVLEALSFNIPVITSDGGALAENAAGGGCVTFTVPQNIQDTKVLTDLIIKFASSKDLLDKLRSEIPNRKTKSWHRYASQILTTIGVDHKQVAE